MKSFRTIVIVYWLKTVLVMYMAFKLWPPDWFEHLLMVTSVIGPLMLLFGVVLYFSNHGYKLALLIMMILTTVWMYANLLYYRFYEDYLSLTILLQVGNVGGLSQSTWELISPWDLLLIVDVVFFAWWFSQRSGFFIQRKEKHRYFRHALTVTAIVVGIAWWHTPHLFQENYNRSQLVTSLSLYSYQLFDITHSLAAPFQKVTAEQQDTKPMKRFIQEKDHVDTKWFGQAEGKNVVFISLESVQNFTIDLEVEGEPVTPFLHQLKEESLYFSNIYEQTAQGKSSDAEFMIDTGLYPLDGGSVFVRRPDNSYQALPQILESYDAAAFHGNERTFWNRENMYASMGYDHFFSERDYDIHSGNTVNYGLKDQAFFRQSIPYLKQLEEPYIGKFITLTNHFPFLLEEKDQTLDTSATSEPVVNRYLSTVHYLDESLRLFFESLKDNGLYKNTVFILYGDHYGISTEYEAGLNKLLDQPDNIFSHVKNQRIPLYIHIPGMNGEEVDKIGGQIDIRSTLLHLLGVREDEFMSFSENLLANNHDKFVVFRDGDFISSSVMYIDGQCYDKNKETPTKTSRCEEGKLKSLQELQLSDQVIIGDWLRFN